MSKYNPYPTQPDSVVHHRDREGRLWTFFEYSPGSVPCGLRRAKVLGHWNNVDAVQAIIRRGEPVYVELEYK